MRDKKMLTFVHGMCIIKTAQEVHDLWTKAEGGLFMGAGEILRELRGERSQSEMAAAIGVTKSSWAMYERGERNPRDEVKRKIAAYFGKTVQEIFFA